MVRRKYPDAWDKLANETTATRNDVAEIDYLSPVAEKPAAPTTNIPRLNQARERSRKRAKQRVNQQEQQMLLDLQARASAHGYDTTKLVPKKNQSVADMAREVHEAFDREDEEQRLWEQGFSPRETPGRLLGNTGQGILSVSRAIGQGLQRLMPVDYQAITNVDRLQTDMETVRGEIISSIVEEQGQDIWDEYSTNFPVEAEQLVTDRMRDLIGVPKFTTSGTPEEQLAASQFQLKRQLDRTVSGESVAEARIRAGSNPRTFVEVGLLPVQAAFGPQEFAGGIAGYGVGKAIDAAIPGDTTNVADYTTLAGMIFGGGGRNPARLRQTATHSDDLLRLGMPANNRGIAAITGLDFMAKEVGEAVDLTKALSRLGIRAALGTKERGQLLLELGKLATPIAARRTRDELASIGRAFQQSFDGSPQAQRGGIGNLEPNRKARIDADKEIEDAATKFVTGEYATPDEWTAAKAEFDAAFEKHRKTLEDLGEDNPYTVPREGDITRPAEGEIEPPVSNQALTQEDLTDRRMTQEEWDLDEYRHPVDYDQEKYDAPTYEMLPDIDGEAEYLRHVEMEMLREDLEASPLTEASKIFDRRGIPEEGLYPEQYYHIFGKGRRNVDVVPTGKKGKVTQRDYIRWAEKAFPDQFRPADVTRTMPRNRPEYRNLMQKRNWTIRLDYTDEVAEQYNYLGASDGPARYTGDGQLESAQALIEDMRDMLSKRQRLADYDAAEEANKLDRELMIDAALDRQQETEAARLAAGANAEAPSSPFVMPKEFSRISPRWRSHPIQFENDFDRLLYQVSAKGKPSKRAADFRKIMEAEFGPEWRSNAKVRRALQETRQELSRLDKATPDGETIVYASTDKWEQLKAEFDLPASPRSQVAPPREATVSGQPEQPPADPLYGTYDGSYGPPRDVRSRDGRPVAQQSTQPGVFTPNEVKDIPTERVTPTGRLTRGREEALEQLEGEFARSAIKTSQLDIASARYLETGDIRDFVDSLPHNSTEPSESFMLGLSTLENKSNRSLQWVDASRAADTVQNGHHGGVVSRDMIWPTRRTWVAKDNFHKQVRMGLHQIRLRNGFKNAPKQVFEDITSVGELVNRELARGNPEDIERMAEVQKIISKYPVEQQKQIVAYTVELRKFFDSLWMMANRAREARGDKLIPYIDAYMPQLMEQNMWNRMIRNQRRGSNIDDLPEHQFIAPQVAFNPRALTRKGGINPKDLERNAEELAVSYIDAMTNDIFNTSILQNIKRHTTAMNKNGLDGPAKYFDEWAAESYGSRPSALSRKLRDFAGPLEPGVDFFMWVRRQLTRAVFPLNWAWNLFIQTSSGTLTVARYGVKDSLKAAIEMFDPAKRAEAHRHAYSYMVKKGDAGALYKQDVGGELNRIDELDRSLIDSVESAGNFLSRKIEEILTMHAVLAAKNRGHDMGLRGRSLWEFASDGGARTQSMYNKEDVVAILRTKEIGTLAPFQTFAFEVFNTMRELMPAGAKLPGGRRIAIGNYQTLSADKAGHNATHMNRAKHILTWAAVAVAWNEVSEYAIDRKPWQLSSFLPFFSILNAGAAGYGPTNQLLFQKYHGEFMDAVRDYMKTGRWHKIRNFAIRYHVFGGSQINKSLQGVEALAEGGVRDSTGKFKFEMDPNDWRDVARAVSTGIYSTNGGREYLREREDTTPFEEFLGFELPSRGGVQGTMNRRYREEFEEYLSIETTAEARREKGQRWSRSEYRERNPQLDARLFVAGRVSSLRTRAARFIAEDMIIDEGLLKKADEKLLQKWRDGLQEGWVDRNMDTETYEPTGGKAQPVEGFVPLSDEPQATPTSALPTAEANWKIISSHMGVTELQALQKAWDGKELSRSEVAALRAVFEKEPLGQDNFNTWMKRTLRQLQQNASIASLVQSSPELANV